MSAYYDVPQIFWMLRRFLLIANAPEPQSSAAALGAPPVDQRAGSLIAKVFFAS
jgi:hypothetical protein